MKKGVFKPLSTVILQVLAHTEIPAIEHEGKTYIELPKPEFEGEEVTETKTPVKKETPAAAKEEIPAAKEVTSFTEVELDDKETSELLTICKGLKIDPDKAEGKNTHKKLKLLILKKQEKLAPKEEAPATEEVDEKPTTKGGKESKFTGEVTKILKDLDAGALNETQTVKKLTELSDDADKDSITRIINEVMDDADTPIEDWIPKVVAVVEGAAPAKDAKPGRGGKAKEELIEDFKNLEEGDKVKVYWKTYDDYWMGKVIAVGRGGVKVHYEDDSKEILDAKEHTEVFRLS